MARMCERELVAADDPEHVEAAEGVEREDAGRGCGGSWSWRR